MKCIKCQTDSKYSERSSGTCPKCSAKFAFEPKSGDVFTDPAFAAAIDRVSASDAVRFTEANLFYELARSRRRAGSKKVILVVLGIAICIVSAIIAAASGSIVPFVIGVLVGATVGVLGVVSKPSPTPELTRGAFSSMLGKWKSAHGTPAKLVHRVAPASKKEATKKALPSELATYSFDRAVICDRPETVDLLLANNFHFENNCAILAVNRYPEAVFGPVLEMLRNNPKIEVYALHDASKTGHDLARQLATSPEWFRGIGRVTDVGILVKHAMKMRGLWQAAHGSPVTFPDLTTEENVWLSQYSLELAAMRPEQVIKRLFRAMTQPGTQVSTDDGAIFFFVGGSFGGSDAGTSDGGGDSFG